MCELSGSTLVNIWLIFGLGTLFTWELGKLLVGSAVTAIKSRRSSSSNATNDTPHRNDRAPEYKE